MNPESGSSSANVAVDFQAEIEVFANDSGGISIKADAGDGQVSLIAFRVCDASAVITAIRRAKKEATP